MLENEFIPYEQSLELKELGFNEACFAFYGIDGNYLIGIDEVRFDTINNYDFNSRISEESNSCSAPLYQQAFRFFREKYGMHGYIEGAYPWFRYYINLEDDRYEGHKESTYEEAELECLKQLIKIVKNK